jgi:large subunit ribosomal protein L10e
MALRRATAYSKKTVVPYTRKSKKKAKAYIKTVPPASIVKYTMGDETAFNAGKFPIHLTLISTENVQIRDGALEACRQSINKKLEKNYLGQYFFRIMIHPHHIQRENKMLTGAGADRMQTGMQLSFGKTIDRAALVKRGHGIFSISVSNKKIEQEVRKMFNVIRPKLPCKTRIESEEIKG